ncbi:MAG: DNA repair protein RadC [Treponema sp.]|jgi:DNA repair protein RadC|nr:DNA repair protein RadC [Treponema sp.]
MNDGILHDCSAPAEVREKKGWKYRTIPVTELHVLPLSLRPRERLIRDGPETLSDYELLAIVLNSGIKGKSVSALAVELLDLIEQDKKLPSIKELRGLTGLGESKAASILAMLEFGRRRWGPFGAKITRPADIYTLIRHYADRKQERFISISLNGAHEVLAVRVVTMGLVNRTLIHPREVFADVIADRSCGICVCHNHPSGETSPSLEDDEVTIALVKAARVLGIQFLDHVIFSETSYYSYRHSHPDIFTIPDPDSEDEGRKAGRTGAC